METLNIMPKLKHFPKDLALVILFTLLCIQTFLWKRKLYQRNGETFSWKEKVYQTTFLPSVKTLTKNIHIFFLSTGSFSKRKCIDRILSVILIISIILALSMTVYVIITPKEGEKFTEFYVLGPGGKAEDYPTSLKVGEEGKVIIGVVNHEYANTSYQLEVRLNGEVINEKSIELMHNETWESSFTFRATRAGEDQKLEFLLYKEGVKDAYRSLHLWMDVT